MPKQLRRTRSATKTAAKKDSTGGSSALGLIKAGISKLTGMSFDAPKKPIAKKPKVKAQPARLPKKGDKAAPSGNYLDLCLLLDCTASMGSWIERAKTTLRQIIDQVKNENPTLTARVCFIGYRDVQDHPRFAIKDFSEDIDAVKAFINQQRA